MTKFGTTVTAVVLLLLLGLGYFFYNSPKDSPLSSITNFEECARAGFPVMESYPAQCRLPSGELFVQVITNPTNPDVIGSPGPNPSTVPDPTPSPDAKPNEKPPQKGACYIGGCSGQICSDEEGVASTCEYREEYACYKTAKCERQSNGACGWTPSSTLNACLENSKTNTDTNSQINPQI